MKKILVTFSIKTNTLPSSGGKEKWILEVGDDIGVIDREVIGRILSRDSRFKEAYSPQDFHIEGFSLVKEEWTYLARDTTDPNGGWFLVNGL
ncbi:MAG: hypothetical protein EOM19_00930 [Candidatus Moranbacteria bacterium]|nr:hypothetical protein [Candidatus Moranbacteria bacterium]